MLWVSFSLLVCQLFETKIFTLVALHGCHKLIVIDKVILNLGLELIKTMLDLRLHTCHRVSWIHGTERSHSFDLGLGGGPQGFHLLALPCHVDCWSHGDVTLVSLD